MYELLKQELNLTLDIFIGLIIGEIIIRLKISDVLLKKFMPFLKRNKIPPVTCIALAASAGSSKTGAALISSSLQNKNISERSAIWSVLMLPLPSYLRRWPQTFAMSVAMAGTTGGFFALSLLLRSTARFFVALYFLKNCNESDYAPEDYEIKAAKTFHVNFFTRLAKMLPFAWIFFALSYSLVPAANRFFQSVFTNTDMFLPLSAWTISAASISHMSSALALAGGSLASGELSTAQALFALILGSGLGTATRILRQNAGYYFGLFPVKTARKMLMLNFATIMPLILINLLFSGLALLF